MSCTDESPAGALCTCASDSEPCETTSYCYNGTCTSQDKCEETLCSDPCACADSQHKVAKQCHGAAQFCKDGVVSYVCEPGVVNVRDCYCKIESAQKCLKNNVCLDGLCYGRGDDIVGILCDPNYRCLDPCACVAPDGTATLCALDFKKCADGKLIDSECTSIATIQDSCRCNFDDFGSCEAGRICISFKCETPDETMPQCRQNEPCFLQCACFKEGRKTGSKCKGSQFECVSGLVKRMCEQGKLNQASCYCERDARRTCGAQNMCLGMQCFGTQESELELSGNFCRENEPCEAECACLQAQSKGGEKCSGKHHRCVNGEVILKCFDGYGHDLTGSECLQCESGCRLCSINKNYCTLCLEGFKLRRGKCTETKINNGAIVGGVFATLAAAAIIGGCIYFICRRIKNQPHEHSQQANPHQSERGGSIACAQ